MNDQAIEFKALAHKIEIMIENVSSLGVDTDVYKQNFREIVKGVEHSTAHSANRPAQAQEMFLIQDYSTGLSKLKKLEWELLRFDIYFQAINFAKYLDSQLNKDMEESVLQTFAEELIQILRALKRSSTLYYDEEKSTVEKLYETTYQMIKLELIKTGSSTIYDYCKNEDIDPYFLDRCIRRDIEKLDLQDEKYAKLKERKLFLESKGMNSNFLDLELIKIILSYDDKDVFCIKIIENLNQIIAEINDNCDEFEKEYNNYFKLEKESKISKKAVIDLGKRITSICLAWTIYVIGASGVFKLTKKICTEEYRPSKIETYSEHGYESRDDLVSISNVLDKVYLKEYGLWEEFHDFFRWYDYKRVVKTYDISHIELNTIKDYLDLDIYSLDITYTESEEERAKEDVGPLYTKEYFEVEKITIDENSIIEKEAEELPFMLTMIYAIYIFILIGLECGFERTEYLGIYNQFYSIQEKKVFRDAKLYKKDLEQLKIITAKLMHIINQDEILRNRFNELYESNKYLLDNPDELLQQIKQLENQEEIKRVLKKA